MIQFHITEMITKHLEINYLNCTNLKGIKYIINSSIENYIIINFF